MARVRRCLEEPTHLASVELFFFCRREPMGGTQSDARLSVTRNAESFVGRWPNARILRAAPRVFLHLQF